MISIDSSLFPIFMRVSQYMNIFSSLRLIVPVLLRRSKSISSSSLDDFQKYSISLDISLFLNLWSISISSTALSISDTSSRSIPTPSAILSSFSSLCISWFSSISYALSIRFCI